MGIPHPDDAIELDTLLIRGGLTRSNYGETSEAIHMTSGFTYGSAAEAEARFTGENPGFVYSRYANPTLDIFEQRLRQIEGAGGCHGTSSGMAAVYAALATSLNAGDHVVASRALFGSCHVILSTILPRYNITTTFVDGDDLKAWESAVRPNTKVFFLETPANPTLALVDLKAVSAIAHAAGAKVIVDNAFATPLLQRPLMLGADIVTYSATKHIDGQGRCLGGAVLGTSEYCTDVLQPFLRHTGPALSPFNAWLLSKGLETLSLRVQRSCDTAEILADHLGDKPQVAKLLYPHHDSHPQVELGRRQMYRGGTILSLELKGGRAAAWAFMDAFKIIDISNNLGDSKSLITHPTTTTHRAMAEEDRLAMGITEGLVRLSVGLEGVNDLLADIDRGLKAAAAHS
ncbi:O-succinylhomoserine sulfhydrylase [Lacibacterium aquatile]|uniref:O-succinylhomoserine sulfhydrylase n=1 Tax=Lacibacterium aquatile TaxID=1168082 RepID=A0ABW5DXY2_9PROT